MTLCLQNLLSKREMAHLGSCNSSNFLGQKDMWVFSKIQIWAIGTREAMELQGTVRVEGTTWKLGGKKENVARRKMKSNILPSSGEWIFILRGRGQENNWWDYSENWNFSWEKISCKYINGQLCIRTFHDSTSKL